MGNPSTDLQLAPCPFCGKAEAVTMSNSAEYHVIDCDCQEDYDRDHALTYAVVCDASSPNGPGGCGASGGFSTTAREAAERWNRRAS